MAEQDIAEVFKLKL